MKTLKKGIALILALMLCLSLCSFGVFADTVSETTISTDTTWTGAKTLTGNLTVNSGVTLTVSNTSLSPVS